MPRTIHERVAPWDDPDRWDARGEDIDPDDIVTDDD